MRLSAKKSIGWAAVLMLLGVAAMFAGPKWLTLFIPVAALVWYGVGPAIQRSRN